MVVRWRVRMLLLPALCCLLLGSCSTAVKMPAGEAGKGSGALAGGVLAIDATVWDFGSIKRGETVTRNFAITNGSTDSLTVSAHTSCDCLIADLEINMLAPGEAADLRLSFIGEDIKEKVTKTVYVLAAEPGTDRVRITVTGQVTPGDGPHLEALPTMLLFERSGEKHGPALLRVINRGAADLSISGIRCYGCEVAGVGFALKPGEEIEIEVGLIEGWTGNRWLELDSNDPVEAMTKVPMVVVE